MHTANLDESSHEHNQGNTHQQHRPPVNHYPFSNVLIELRVEDGFLQSGQRPIGIHQPALHEHVAVAFEVVAGRASLQRGHLPVEELGQALRACTAACAGVHFLHAANMAELGLILSVPTSTGTHLQPIFLTDRARTTPIKADLSFSMAGSEVGFGLRGGALG